MAPAKDVATRVAVAVLAEEAVLVVEGRLNNLLTRVKRCRARCHKITASVRIATAGTSVSNTSLVDVKMVWMGFVGKVPACACIYAPPLLTSPT